MILNVEDEKHQKCQRYSIRSLCLNGFLASAIFLFIFDAYFEKLNINKILINTLWSNIQNQTINSDCSPYYNLNKTFQITIDNETYPKYTPLYNNINFNFKCMNNNKKTKVILFWNKWFGDSTFEYGLGQETPFKENNCPVTNCETTNDRQKLKESDLIVFHMRDSIDYLPPERYPNQRWVFLLYESPVHSPDFKIYNNLFNLSATYKLNSDFTSIYLKNYVWIENNIDFNVSNDFSNGKTGFAAAVISNCGGSSRRLEYIKELQQSIEVKIFGKCGKPCPKSFENGTDCKEIIGNNYKFFFAFENSVCSDYITEKFFDILPFNIIPVVFGGGNYSQFVPKSGYINALDFKSPKKLADYLIFLDKNKTAYNSYFKWKKHVRFFNNGPRMHNLCELCIRLNLDFYNGVKNSVIGDLHKFWSTDYDCKSVEGKTFKVQ
jgi:alpha-1,3-fucosyltransferase